MFQSKQRTALCWPGAAGLLGLIAALTCSSADGTQGPQRPADAATIVLAAPDSLGTSERPPVGFPHDVHAIALDSTALDSVSCDVCHDRDDKKRVVPRFKHVGTVSDLEELGDAYHAGCLGCHEERVAAGQPSGPVGCGECHARAPAIVQRTAMRFDYSLHARHVRAEKDRCETCHHVYNEEEKKLEPGKGKESSCRDCHGATDDENTLSLRNAVHTDCVSCHLERVGKEDAAGNEESAGPIECLGCHDELRQLGIIELETIPRRQRGQPDQLWIRVPGATTNLVPFDHQHHEAQGESCATCHHQTMQPCRECHTLAGAAEGGGVTLAEAFHDPQAAESCVGCHQQKLMADPKCAGCHMLLSGTPGTGSCQICHRGPRLAKDAQVAVPDTSDGPAYLTVVAGASAQDFFQPVPPPTVPATSDDFPDSLRIDVLAREYQAAPLPHRRIVAAGAAAIGENVLARRFHDPADLELCAGCHHRSPVGDRPPRCISCHGQAAHPTTDQPHLLAAYHRQCITCHQVMGLVTECAKCHPPATEEVLP